MVGWNVEPHCAAEGQALMMAMPGHLLHAGRRPGEPPAAGLGLLWAGPWLLDRAGSRQLLCIPTQAGVGEGWQG